MKKRIFVLALLSFLLLLALPVSAAPFTQSDPLYYTGRNTYVVENRSSQAATGIVLTVPAVWPEPFANQVLVISRWSRTPAEIRRDERGNVVVDIHIPRLEAWGRTEVVLEYLVRNYAFSFDLNRSYGPFPAPPAFYTQPEEKVESTHPEIVAKAAEVTAGKTGNLEKARAIFAFVQQYLRYDTSTGNQGALSALRNRSGVCEDYASLFTALCRASGIPARLVYGQAVNLAKGTSEGHAWAEFFLSSHGWIPVEPTVTSQQVPWQFFASLPADYRNVAFSLNRTSVKWQWSGYGQVRVSGSSSVRAGKHISLYSDLDNHWARSAVESLALKGITISDEALFYPTRPLTRAEAAKLMALSNGLPPVFGSSSFRDVAVTSWYHPYVESCKRAGIFGGFEDGTFRPADFITREQMAVILARSFGFDGKTGDTSLPFTDTASIAAWALPGVTYSVGIKLFVGDTQNRFQPKAFCSRAEAAALFERYLRMK